MSKKGSNKGGSVGNEYHTLNPEQKQKVSTLHDQFPVCDKSVIVIVLKYCQFDADSAVHMLTQDGGLEALSQWSSTQGNQVKTNNKTKKRNKKKGKKDDNSTSATNLGTDADDSSSLHSSNIDFDAEKEPNSKQDCDATANHAAQDPSDCNNLACSLTSEEISYSETGNKTDGSGDSSRVTIANSTEENSVDSLTTNPSTVGADSKDGDSPDKKNVSGNSPRERGDSSKFPPQKSVYRQRHGSSHYKSSLSEDTQANQATNKQVKGGLSKCQKDLQRQMFSLQRINSVLTEHLEHSAKKLKNAFAELHTKLDERQSQLEEEFTKVSEEALSLLKSRQDLSTELKRKCDRAMSMNEAEWNELRAGIKQFVIERRFDEELGKTIWFQWEIDSLLNSIAQFGEVQPVKNSYSQGKARSQNSPSPNSSTADPNTEETVGAASCLGAEKAVCNEAVENAHPEKEDPSKNNPYVEGPRHSSGFPSHYRGRFDYINNRRFSRKRGNMGNPNYRYNKNQNYQYSAYGPNYVSHDGWNQMPHRQMDQHIPSGRRYDTNRGMHHGRFNNGQKQRMFFRSSNNGRSMRPHAPANNSDREKLPASDKNANYNNEGTESKELHNGLEGL